MQTLLGAALSHHSDWHTGMAALPQTPTFSLRAACGHCVTHRLCHPWSLAAPPPRGSLPRTPSFLNGSRVVGFPQAAAPQALPRHGSVPRGPPFRRCSSAGPTGSSSPGPPAAPRAALVGLQLRPGGIRVLCRPQAASAAAPGAAPCCAHGLQGTACSTTGLCWAAGSCYSAHGTPPALTRCL